MKNKKATALMMATLVGTSMLLNTGGTVVYAQDTDIHLEDQRVSEENSITENEELSETVGEETEQETTGEMIPAEDTAVIEEQEPTEEESRQSAPEKVETDVAEKTDGEKQTAKASILDNWEYVEYNGGYYLERYTGTETDVTIPAEIEGKQVYVEGTGSLLNDTAGIIPASVTSIRIQEINGKKVKVRGRTLQYFLGGKKNLQKADVSGLDVGNITSMYGMFMNCASLSDITGLETWDTSKVTDIGFMFNDCASLSDITALETWDTSRVTRMKAMFSGCKSLSDITGLETWDTSKVTDIGFMFNDCASLSDITALKTWDTSQVASMRGMFVRCKSLSDITVLKDWDTSKVIDIGFMFNDCVSLSDITALKTWDTSQVTTMDAVFYGSGISDTAALKDWDTSSVTKMLHMFSNCKNLSEITALKDWDVSKVKNMMWMFWGCENLTMLDLSGWKLDQVKLESGVFMNDSRVPLLVVATDEKLKQYDYETDRRIRLENIFDTNGGRFESGVTEHRIGHDFVIEDISDAGMNALIENAKNMVETISGIPVKDGYRFAGWEANALQLTGDPLQDAYNILSNRFTAKWSRVRDVTFDSNGGSNIDGQTVEEGGFIKEPEEPVKTGHRFAGWYTDNTFTTKWEFDKNRMPAENITLYAKWDLNASILNQVPTIHAEDKVLTVGETFEPLEGVTAFDAEDRDIALTQENIIANDVDMSQAGTYHVTYQVTDSQGATAKKTITVVVNPKMEELNQVPTIHAEDKVLTVGDAFNPLEGVTAFDEEDRDIALTQENIIANDVDMSQAGTYHVTYQVTDSQGATAKKTITVVVNPKMEELNQVPTIHAEDKVLTVGDAFNPLEGVTAFDEEDRDIALTQENIIANDVDMSRAGTYHVTYQVTDSQGATAKKTITVVVNPKMEELNQVPTIHAEDKVLTVGDAFNPLEGVTAFDEEDRDIALTQENIIANDVDMSQAGTYHVTYQVTDSQGATTKKTITVTVKEKEVQEPQKPQKPDQPAEGNRPNKPDSPAKPTKPSQTPQTGDASAVGTMLSVLTGSAGFLTVMFRKKRRKAIEKNAEEKR